MPTMQTVQSTACLAARDHIQKSRSDHIREQLDAASGDMKSTWRVAQRLLHTNRQAVHGDADCATLVATFSQYFVQKISQIRANIESTLQSMTVRHFEVRRHAGPKLSTLSEVTLD